MPFDVVQAPDLQWEKRDAPEGTEPRQQAPITDHAKLTQSRARMWRYPAHTRGRRHIDPGQEEAQLALAALGSEPAPPPAGGSLFSRLRDRH